MAATEKSPAPPAGDAKRPAQVPGDAESPPKGTPSPAAKRAADHTDPTEPTRTSRESGG